MKTAVAGGLGKGRIVITAEFARRDHSVTGIGRNPDRIAKLPNVTAVKGNALDRVELARRWAGHDAAISSIHFLVSDPTSSASGPISC